MILSRRYDEESKRGNIIWYQRATRRSICFDERRYFLSFPCMLFKVIYDQDVWGKIKNPFKTYFLKVAFVKNKKLYEPKLPNIFDGFDVCIPCISGESPEQLLQKQIELFWQTEFTCDGDCLFYYFDEDDYSIADENDVHAMFEKWEQKTKNNPKYVPRGLIEADTDYSFFLEDME